MLTPWSAPDGALIEWAFPDNSRKFDSTGAVIFEPIPNPAPTRLNAKAPRAGEHPDWFALRYCEGDLRRVSIPLGIGSGALFRAHLGAGREAELVSTVIPAFFDRAGRQPNPWNIKLGEFDVTSFHDFLAMVGSKLGSAIAQFPPSMENSGLSTDPAHPMPAPIFREDMPEGKVYPEGPFAVIGNQKVWWINLRHPAAVVSPVVDKDGGEVARITATLDQAQRLAVSLSDLAFSEKVKLPSSGGGVPVSTLRDLRPLISQLVALLKGA